MVPRSEMGSASQLVDARLVELEKEEEHKEEALHGHPPTITSFIASHPSYMQVAVDDLDDEDPELMVIEPDEEPIYPEGPFNLALSDVRENAILNFNTLDEDGKEQVVNYFKALIDNVDYPRQRVKEMQQHYKKFPKATRDELLDYFIAKHKTEYRTILFHTLLAYLGEGFYLLWDYLSRVELGELLLPDSLQAENVPLNIFITPLIVTANITFDPVADVVSHMRNKMITNKTFINDVKDHSFLALMFFFYAFGGGYVEVVDIEAFLQAIFGEAKWIFISILLYAAIIYYTAYNFADTIKSVEAFKHTPSLLKKVVDPFNGEIWKERKIAAWCLTHQTLSWVERIARMSYGGVMAGLQQEGPEAGIGLGSLVGAGTALGPAFTRVMAAYKMYNPPLILPPKHMNPARKEKYEAELREQQVAFGNAKDEFDRRYARAPYKNEFLLFLTPTLFLLAVPSIFIYTATEYFGIDNEAGKDITGVLLAGAVGVAIHWLLGLRDPAIRREVIRLMEAATPDVSGSVKLKPNEFAKSLATLSNCADQGSRSFTFGYSLMKMLPSVFNTLDLWGKRRLAASIAFAAFIATSQFRYQRDKVEESIVSMFPSYLSTESDVKGRLMRFFRIPQSAQSSQLTAQVELTSDGSNQHEEDGLLNGERKEDSRPYRPSYRTSFSTTAAS